MALRVAISAGHGPNTPGKRSPDGVKEFQFNYPTAEYLATYLLEYENVSILKVYEKNRDVPLSERTNRANTWGADLYLSIHYNAFGSTWNDAQGIETLVYNTSTAKNNGYSVAKFIHPELIKLTKRRDRGIKVRPDLWELRVTTMRAVLCECGFMTNRSERNLMTSASYQQTVARAICNGVVKFYGLKKKASVSPPKQEDNTNKTFYRVQTGAYKSLNNATRQMYELRNKGYKDAWINSDDGIHRVQVGAFSEYKNAENLRNELRNNGYIGTWISES